jgi:biopolymer transport protein ExbB
LALLYYLVRKDFFLPNAVRLAGRLGFRQVLFFCCGAGVITVSLFLVAHWQFPDRANTAGWDLRSMWALMSRPGRGIVAVLFVLSLYSFGVMIDRYLMYASAREQSRSVVTQISDALKEGKLEEAISITERHKKSRVAQVVAGGLLELRASSRGVAHARVIEAASRATERSVASVHNDMERHLSALTVIGSVAPFVGLFGTVVGILNGFKAMEVSHAASLSSFIGAVAEALVTATWGLLIAVPTVWAYNYFEGRLKGFDSEMDQSRNEILNYIASGRVAEK